VVLFNSLYIDAAVKQLSADGFPVTDELLARLFPLQCDHINFLGRYAFTSPPTPGLRPLRDPQQEDGDDDAQSLNGRSRRRVWKNASHFPSRFAAAALRANTLSCDSCISRRAAFRSFCPSRSRYRWPCR
jgi:hypothetical protein